MVVGGFGPWTHTSDDSYMYQLSLVVAIASISLRQDALGMWAAVVQVRKGVF